MVYHSTNTSADAPYLHELGHRYHYEVIENIAKSKKVSYNTAKQLFENDIIEHIKSMLPEQQQYVEEGIGIYAKESYTAGGADRKMNEVMAEWFTVKDLENPSELVSFISETVRKWLV